MKNRFLFLVILNATSKEMANSVNASMAMDVNIDTTRLKKKYDNRCGAMFPAHCETAEHNAAELMMTTMSGFLT